MGKSSRLLALAWTLATASGCSFLYDPDDLNRGEGTSIDGGHVGPDAAPDALHVQQVTPQLVYEGQGDALDPADRPLSRAIPVVLLGSNFTDDMIVTLSGDAFERQDVPFSVSGDGHWAAFEIRIPVDEERGANMDLPLAITMTKGDEVLERGLVRRMLPELDRVSGAIETTVAGEVSLYSRVDLRGIVEARGANPVRLVGYAGIRLDGRLGAEGSGQSPGVGGCSGGNVAMDAACGAGSGRGGKSTDISHGPGGGGGGAFGTADAQSGGGEGQGGEPGEPTAAPTLVPMPPQSQAPAGGGGGGRTVDPSSGEAGGGSGGILELTSPAVIRLAGIVSVDGASASPCEGFVGGGGGGGGSGGALLLRAGAGLIADPLSRLSARGGEGGSVNCTTPGGAGGFGVIRVDVPEELTVETEPAVVPGPALTVENVAIVTAADLAIAVRGKAGSSYKVRVSGFDRTSNQPAESTRLVATPDGTGGATVPLWEGHNEICVEADANTEYPESQNCLTIAYIP